MLKAAVSATLLTLAFSGAANATSTYNNCSKLGDSSSGIYFESGSEQPSPNASEHAFENLHLVAGDMRETYKIGGDDLYRADCNATNGGSSRLSLDGRKYVSINKIYHCGNGTSLTVQFDTSKAAPNGSVKRVFTNGSTIQFELNCN